MGSLARYWPAPKGGKCPLTAGGNASFAEKGWSEMTDHGRRSGRRVGSSVRDSPCRSPLRILSSCLTSGLTSHLWNFDSEEFCPGAIRGGWRARKACSQQRRIFLIDPFLNITSLSYCPHQIDASCMSSSTAAPIEEPSSSHKRKRAPRALIACETCRTRKLRCDQASPCAHCLRLSQPCNYRSPGIQLPGPRIASAAPESGFIVR